ncbi:transposase [Desulfococcaceae bacterium HSG7]|nr:transposase [Desulfococcaceae bacterium HSG7]
MNNSTAAHKDIAPEFTYPQPKNEITIGDIGDKSLSLDFDGGDISSDGGALAEGGAQIACRYEDANGCDDLRDDPVFKILAGRYPEIGDALSSQPTVSRFECSITRTTIFRLATMFVDVFVTSYAFPSPVIVPDFDDTEDRGHGNRRLNLFNAY